MTQPTTNDAPVVSTSGPVSITERLRSIDTLRGVALLGILVMNIQSFAMPMTAYMNPTAYGDLNGANYWVWTLSHVFADMKFMSIFSMLFGAGILILTSRAEATGRSAARIHYSRIGWLLLIGLVHAYLIWYGDILTLYAICGLFVFLMRRWRPWTLVVVSILMMFVASALMPGLGSLYGEARRAVNAELAADPVGEIVDPQMLQAHDQLTDVMDRWHPNEQALAEEIAIMKGSYVDSLALRAPVTAKFHAFGFPLWGIWRAGGMMVLGMALFKWGVMSATRSTLHYMGMVVLGLGIGIPLIVVGIQSNQANDFDLIHWKINTSYNYFASVFMALAWVGLVMLWCKTSLLAWLQHALASVGQMALTNYLMHTIVCTAVFNGYSGLGLGLFGDFDRVDQVLMVLGVWTFQLVASPLWLARFRFGPAEWVWRSLTYWKLQPMRLQPQSA